MEYLEDNLEEWLGEELEVCSGLHKTMFGGPSDHTVFALIWDRTQCPGPWPGPVGARKVVHCTQIYCASSLGHRTCITASCPGAVAWLKGLRKSTIEWLGEEREVRL